MGSTGLEVGKGATNPALRGLARGGKTFTQDASNSEPLIVWNLRGCDLEGRKKKKAKYRRLSHLMGERMGGPSGCLVSEQRGGLCRSKDLGGTSWKTGHSSTLEGGEGQVGEEQGGVGNLSAFLSWRPGNRKGRKWRT